MAHPAEVEATSYHTHQTESVLEARLRRFRIYVSKLCHDPLNLGSPSAPSLSTCRNLVLAYSAVEHDTVIRTHTQQPQIPKTSTIYHMTYCTSRVHRESCYIRKLIVKKYTKALFICYR